MQREESPNGPRDRLPSWRAEWAGDSELSITGSMQEANVILQVGLTDFRGA